MKAKRRRRTAAEWKAEATPKTKNDRPDYSQHEGDPGYVRGCTFQGRWVRYRGLRFEYRGDGELWTPGDAEAVCLYRPGQSFWKDIPDPFGRGVWSIADHWIDNDER